jgi:hypothetical protein
MQPGEETRSRPGGHLSLVRTPYPWLGTKFVRFMVVVLALTRDKARESGICGSSGRAEGRPAARELRREGHVWLMGLVRPAVQSAKRLANARVRLGPDLGHMRGRTGQAIGLRSGSRAGQADRRGCSAGAGPCGPGGPTDEVVRPGQVLTVRAGRRTRSFGRGRSGYAAQPGHRNRLKADPGASRPGEARGWGYEP